MMLLLLVMIIGLLPIKFPRWVYADWQYAKRHGLLDADGNIDQEAYENHADRKEFLVNDHDTFNLVTGAPADSVIRWTDRTLRWREVWRRSQLSH